MRQTWYGCWVTGSAKCEARTASCASDLRDRAAKVREPGCIAPTSRRWAWSAGAPGGSLTWWGTRARALMVCAKGGWILGNCERVRMRRLDGLHVTTHYRRWSHGETPTTASRQPGQLVILIPHGDHLKAQLNISRRRCWDLNANWYQSFLTVPLEHPTGHF